MSIKSTFRKTRSPKIFTSESEIEYTFKNELGSIMEIRFESGGGIMTGTYTSGVSDPNTYPLTGFVSGNVITFTVSYTNFGSISAWAGQAYWNDNLNLWQIDTLWHLVEPTSEADMWEDTYAGHDLFTQVV